MAWSHFSVSKCSVQLARGDRALSELITAWLCRSIDINLADMCTVKIKASAFGDQRVYGVVTVGRGLIVYYVRCYVS